MPAVRRAAAVGFIALFGVAVLNGVVMVSYINRLLQKGMPMSEAVATGAAVRLRPVLMTSMAAAFGMLPLAYGIGSGADMLRPLAIAVIGALCISVLLSLVATPAVYLLMRRR